MQYTQKYTLVQFLEPVAPGTQFHMAEWPLHTTLADVFAIDLESTHIIQQLKELLATIRPLKLIAGQITNLESNNNFITVTLLNRTEELQALHEMLIELLEKNRAVFNSPEYTRNGFLPHVTVQAAGKLACGKVVYINSLAFIDMYPNADAAQRKVIATIPLGTHRRAIPAGGAQNHERIVTYSTIYGAILAVSIPLSLVFWILDSNGYTMLIIDFIALIALLTVAAIASFTLKGRARTIFGVLAIINFLLLLPVGFVILLGTLFTIFPNPLSS
jgi:hypothetical protein